MHENQNWSVAVQAFMVTPLLRIQLPEEGWVEMSFDLQTKLQAGGTITLAGNTSAEITEEKICVEPPNDATLNVYEFEAPPGISIKLLEGTTLEIPKGKVVALDVRSFGLDKVWKVMLPAQTRVILPPAKDPTKPPSRYAVTDTRGKTNLFWLYERGSFVLREGGSVTWPRSE